jgi:hypothetical protein
MIISESFASDQTVGIQYALYFHLVHVTKVGGSRGII